MLRFFKVNDPYRLLFLLILLLLIRLPFYLNGIAVLLPDLHHMLIGERLADGNILYKDLWVNIGPFSAAFYTLIHWIFGKSITAYHVLGLLLVFIQAVLFNRLAISNKIYTENNYVPAVVYVILMSISSDMFAVSPIMLATTFVLLAMNNIFGQIEFRVKRDEKILSIGAYLGVSALFYFPAILFGLLALAGLALFSSTLFRRYLLIVYGLVLPFLMMITYYFIVGNISDSLQIFFSSWFEADTYRMDGFAIGVFCAMPILFLAMAIFRVLKGARFSNYQARIAQMMLFWIAGSCVLLVKPISSLSDLILFIPPAAYFITQYFTLSKKKVFPEVAFLVFILSTTSLSYLTFIGYKSIAEHVSHEPLKIQKSRYDNITYGQSLWVVGEGIDLYKDSSLGSKFYNWSTYNQLITPKEYNKESISLVYKDLTENTPNIIIDLKGVMPNLLDAMPKFNSEYELLEKGVYLRKGFELKSP